MIGRGSNFDKSHRARIVEESNPLKCVADVYGDTITDSRLNAERIVAEHNTHDRAKAAIRRLIDALGPDRVRQDRIDAIKAAQATLADMEG